MNNAMDFKNALLDTLRYYGEDTRRRSSDGSFCFFMHEDGRRCAVGRFVLPEKESFFKEMDQAHNSNIEAAVHEHQRRARSEGRDITEEEAIHELVGISDANINDLMLLEILHDEECNWDKDGLTDFGRETVKHFRPDLVEIFQQLDNRVIVHY